MYAKIYKEIFLKNYTLKKHIKDNIWMVRVFDQRYYLYVYEDTEEVFDEEGNLMPNFSEAELLKYKDIEDIERRIAYNRKFYEDLKKFKSKYSYLFRKKETQQACLFNIDNFNC